MSLSAALNIGASGLLTHQAAIEVTGNNLANVATPGYHRQTPVLAPIPSQQIDRNIFIGRGVQLVAIIRQVDEALEGRIRDALSNEAATGTKQYVLSQVESIYGELTDTDLSSQLNAFFNSWSQLVNEPQNESLRSLVTQTGRTLAEFINEMSASLSDLQTQTDRSIDQAVAGVNDDLTRLEQINAQIARDEVGTGTNGTLRDQRDELLADLAQYMDISVQNHESGSVDVYVGSTPILLNGRARLLEVDRSTVDGESVITVQLQDDETVVSPTSGKLGALINARSGSVGEAIDGLDNFAHYLIQEVNKVYSQGQGLVGFRTVTSTNGVSDATAALNSDDADLAFTPVHGAFQIHVTDKSSGQRVANLIDIDLDGIGSDTSLNDVAAAIDGLANVSATVLADGRLKITADSGNYEVSFSDDTSGFLATLGINTFFTGEKARDIDVNAILAGNPALLAVGRGHVTGDNTNAFALGRIGDAAIGGLNGRSLRNLWDGQVADLAVNSGQASAQLKSDAAVRESLQSQQQQTSGVNADEEAVNLLMYQRAYQASARFLTVVDELTDTLLNLL